MVAVSVVRVRNCSVDRHRVTVVTRVLAPLHLVEPATTVFSVKYFVDTAVIVVWIAELMVLAERVAVTTTAGKVTVTTDDSVR